MFRPKRVVIVVFAMTLAALTGCTSTPRHEASQLQTVFSTQPNPWRAAAPIEAGVNGDRTTLYLEVGEGTIDRNSPCFLRYRGTVAVHGPRIEVRMQSKQNAPVICGLVGMGNWFVRIRLDHPLPVHSVMHAPPPFRRDGWKVLPYQELLGDHVPLFLTLEPPG